MVGDAIGAGGVVVYEAEVEFAIGSSFSGKTEGVKAFGQGTGWVFGVVLVVFDRELGFGVQNLAIWGEDASTVESKDSGITTRRLVRI